MKCPYCSNEIPNNSIECEVCGVNLENSLKQRKDLKVLSIAALVVGIVFLFVSILWTVALKVPSLIFKDFSVPDVKVLAPSNVGTFIIGFVFLVLGIFGLKNSDKLRDTNEKNTLFASFFAICFVFMFIVLLCCSFGITYSAFNRTGMFGNYGFIILIPGLAIPITVLIAIIVAFLKGLRK